MRAARAGDSPAAGPGPVSRTAWTGASEPHCGGRALLGWRQQGDRPRRPHVPAAQRTAEQPPDTGSGHRTPRPDAGQPTRRRTPRPADASPQPPGTAEVLTSGTGQPPDSRTATPQTADTCKAAGHCRIHRRKPREQPSSGLRQWTPPAPRTRRTPAAGDPDGRHMVSGHRGRPGAGACGSGRLGEPSDPCPLPRSRARPCGCRLAARLQPPGVSDHGRPQVEGLGDQPRSDRRRAGVPAERESRP